jgi:hypothetical protein
LLAESRHIGNDHRKGEANRGNRAGCGNYSFHLVRIPLDVGIELEPMPKALIDRSPKYLYGFPLLPWSRLHGRHLNLTA